ncbi:AMP-dependent acyl-CoA synthetase [Azorhizobium oxalatiphilum]|uniref:AMP-dependent acyl-CoA synthetase n=1 Tax=Azorhizobium oxalatiphilum TaxID=980631 RepID=A0A917C372_9HYPH|nr:AMP-binding protein [Azorhizobium oxalatiphilum]GGF68601.1 AMP-dependent acyl-CoA synthetase [Azorhizobium oxalatiphilum]
MIDPSCAGLLGEHRAPSTPLLWDDAGRRWLSAGEVRAEVLMLAATMARPGKQLIFLLAANHRSSLIGLLAAAAAGHAVALVDPTLPPEKLAALRDRYRPEIVLAADPSPALALCGGSNWTHVAVEGARPFMAYRQDAEADSPPAPELGLLLLTSGTTGSAKFVRLSWSAVTANARQIAESLAITPDSVAIAHLPLHYSYGLSVATSHLVAGGRIAFLEDAITSPDFWGKVLASGGTHFPGVPFHYSVLARLGLELVPPSVDTFTQAGGHLDARFQTLMQAKASDRGARFFVMYGQTEAAPRMACLPSERLPEKLGSVGIAMPGGCLRIEDAEGRLLPAGETGGVVYEGANVMLGYAEHRADLTRGDIMGGRLETGDLGRLDAEGFLFLSGRAARFAKIAGLRLSLDDMERDLGVLGMVACVDLGERIAVAFEGDMPADAKERAKALARACKIPATSFLIRTLPELARKSSGKIDYARVKEALNV